MKKVISMLLVLLMLLSVSAFALADGANESYKPYQKYFNIGDSIARGCGIPGHQENTYYNDDWNNTNGGHSAQGSFPAYVANAINPEKTEADANFHYMGMRTIETYYGLGGDVDPWTYDDFCNEDFGYHIRGNDGIEALMGDFQNAAATSDLITLQIGSNDVFYSALSVSGLMDAFGSGDTSALISALGDYLKLTAKGFVGFLEYYPKIIERIFELQAEAGRSADDFDLVLVGVYNPYSNTPVTDDILIPLMESTSVMTGSMNAFLRSLADKYDNVYYADMASVQTPVTTGEISFLSSFTGGYDSNVVTHPTMEGYAYIARQILNALPKVEAQEYPQTYIQFNLPTNFKVEKVALNGIPASFTQDGYQLVVPNRSKLLTSMTVTGKDADGNTLVFVYQLAFHPGEGYSYYRLTSTNNLGASVNRVGTAAKNITDTIVTGIGNLFKK